jgi:EpsI family protein
MRAADVNLPDNYRIDLSRRQLLFGGSMVVAGAAAVAAMPKRGRALLQDGQLEQVIPKRIGPWQFASNSGLVIPPRDENERLVYDQVLTRVYTAPNLPAIMLLIAFGGGQTGLFEIHRPEACYPSQGYHLWGKHDVTLPVSPAVTVPGVFWSAANDLRTEQLLYWTRVGHNFPVTWFQSKVAVIGNNLQRHLPDGVLVRISTASPDAAAALPLLQQFASRLIASVNPLGRRVLIGV